MLLNLDNVFQSACIPNALLHMLWRDRCTNAAAATSAGTLDVYSATERLAIPRTQIHSRFEDGTVAFLDIAALQGGFDILNRLTMPAIRDHAFACAQYLARALQALTHYNGAPVGVVFYPSAIAWAWDECVGVYSSSHVRTACHQRHRSGV